MNDSVEAPIAVVRARLPYIDRRALSQAWFSAMHAASDAPQRVPTRRTTDTERDANAKRATANATADAKARDDARVVARDARNGRAPGAIEETFARRLVERTARVARADAVDRARSYPSFHSSLTIGVDGERVQLVLRRRGPTLHVVAVCTRANVALVRRALACADAHLRLRGESVRASVVAS